MKLILVLPATASGARAALPPALARLAAYCEPAMDGRGMVPAVLTVLGMPETAPAPLLALGAGLPPMAPGDCVMAATPVHLAIHGDDVRIAGRAAGLSEDYVARAIGLLNATFATDDIGFLAARSDAWFAHMPQLPGITAVPVDTAIGGSLYACRPQGRDARLWERYGNEIQMLLFGLNDSTGLTGETRSALEGLLPNAVWFWGGGALPESSSLRGIRAFASTADTSDAADLARGLMLASTGKSQASPANYAALAAAAIDQDAMVVLPDTAEDALAERWLSPALTALESGEVSRMTVLAGNAPAGVWTAASPSWLARIRARLAVARAPRPRVDAHVVTPQPERPVRPRA